MPCLKINVLFGGLEINRYFYAQKLTDGNIK
jgi:hypothetical protein